MSETVVTIIEARPTAVWARLRSLWTYRAFYPLLLREIAIRKFRDTFLGFWWLVIRPLLPTAVAVIVFTTIVRLETPVPYALFYLSGFVVWNMMAGTVTFMPRTLLWMRGMTRKVYFPRLLIPMASIGPPLVEFLVVIGVLAIAIAWYAVQDGALHLVVDFRTLLFFPVVFLALLLGFAIGMVASVMALFLRDIVFSMGYFTQAWFFATPLLYPIENVPAHLQPWFYALNPMTALIEASRWALFRTGSLEPFWLGVSALEIAVITALAIWFFLRAETHLADAM